MSGLKVKSQGIEVLADVRPLEVFQLSVGYGMVFCAFARTGYSYGKRTDRHTNKLTLLSKLLELVHRKRKTLDTGGQNKPLHVEIRYHKFGKPFLLVGGTPGPSVSFSYSDGSIWSALCDNDFSCGIDAAGRSEFSLSYPFHRAFLSEELRRGREITQTDSHETSALLWSAKEAVVKAIGCGFHQLEPLHVRILPHPGSFGPAFEFDTEIIGTALRGSPYPQKSSITVRSFKHGEDWISVALEDRKNVGKTL